MGTRSRIALRESNGTIRSIYCQWDGYPEELGRKLLENYRNADVVGKLLSFGDRSALMPTPSLSESYADRGELVIGCQMVSETLDDLNKADCGEEFVYLYEPGEDRWYYTPTRSRSWQELTPAIVAD